MVYVQTLEDVPDQVENLTFSNVYDTSLDISWQKPIETNGYLIGYELEWYQMNSTQSPSNADRSTMEIKPHLTTYTINHLSATTWYTIGVRAKTRKGFGLKRSASIESGYPPEMPSPPTNLEVIAIEKRSATVKFSPGYTGKTNILRYLVQIQMRSNNSQWETIEAFNMDQSSLILRDLYPNQLYRVRMSAVNVKGSSNTSVPTEFFRTKPDVPSSVPHLLVAQAINASALRIRWMPIATTGWNAASSTGKDIGYGLSINDSNIGEIKIEDPLAKEFVVNGLSPPNTLFRIRMHTFNSIGMSDTFIETTEKTFESGTSIRIVVSIVERFHDSSASPSIDACQHRFDQWIIRSPAMELFKTQRSRWSDHPLQSNHHSPMKDGREILLHYRSCTTLVGRHTRSKRSTMPTTAHQCCTR